MQMIGLFFLVAVATGGVAWVFVYPLISGERNAEKRKQSVAQAVPAARVGAARAAHKSRREQVEGSLRELEQRRAKAKSLPLATRITHAGLNWSKRRFFITAAAFGTAAFMLGLGVSAGLPASAGLGFVGAFGLPLWMLRYLKRRREAKFLAALPDAVDVIVRGIKSGLPLIDSMKVIVADAPEPLRSEFRAILDTQAIGIPLGEACNKLYERTPVAEANFFAIVVAIQQKAGGNLSEALGNLSRVLRDRKKMQAKIQAMSMEAKASAAIIGSLPPIVMGLMYFTSPQYIELLWTEQMGRMLLMGCGLWMLAGVLVMRKMINFDF